MRSHRVYNLSAGDRSQWPALVLVATRSTWSRLHGFLATSNRNHRPHTVGTERFGLLYSVLVRRMHHNLQQPPSASLFGRGAFMCICRTRLSVSSALDMAQPPIQDTRPLQVIVDDGLSLPLYGYLSQRQETEHTMYGFSYRKIPRTPDGFPVIYYLGPEQELT